MSMSKEDIRWRLKAYDKWKIGELEITVGGNEIRTKQLKDCWELQRRIEEKNQRGFQQILGNEQFPKRGLRLEVKI
jgi:hypothetical protein